MRKIEPYVRYNGTCEEAFNFYKSVLGGEFVYVMRHKDNPEKDHPLAKEDEEKILHIALPIGDSMLLMGADTTSDKPVQVGDNITLAMSIQEEEEVRNLFEGLSAGGEITLPLQKTFWADLYGEFTDKYGIHWIVSCAKGEDA
ncbi:MAG: VOC family protein [Tannerellaceae bacterium]|nr:VOC family protein [Tannerellaceae bacterium]